MKNAILQEKSRVHKSGRLVAACAALSFGVSIGALADVLVPSGGDDWQMLSDAITAGGTVELGEGTFRISKALESSTSKAVTIKGAGMDKTFVTPTVTGIRGFYLKHKNTELADLTVCGFGGKSNSNAIRVYAGTIRRCHITRNLNAGNGTGVYFENANGKIYDSIIDFNTDPNDGSGIYSAGGYIEGCLVVSNNVGSAGRGAISAKGGSIVNCTVADNGAGGIIVWTTAATVSNCICKANAFGDAYCDFGGSRAPDIGISFIYGRGAVDQEAKTFNTFTGHEVAFVDAVHGDYRLRPDSMGTDPAAPAGCLPFDATVNAVGFVTESDGYAVGSNVTFTANLFGEYAGADCSWTITGPDDVVVTGEGNPFVTSFDTVGTYSVKLEAGAAPAVTKSNYFRVVPAEIAVAVGDSLADAVAAAENGTVIKLADGEHPLTAQLTIGKNIAIIGNGKDKCTIKQTASARAILMYARGASLEGVTLTGGNASDAMATGLSGGGLLIAGDGGTARWCRFTNNKTSGSNHDGGGICISTPYGTVTHSVIDNCSTTRYGGGVYLYYGGLLDNCLIHHNSAQYGGGVLSCVPGSKARNCTMAKNTATQRGGGICVNGTAAGGEFVNCLVSDNTANNDQVLEGKPDWSAQNGTGAVKNILTAGRYCAFGSSSALGETSITVVAPMMDPDNDDYTLKASSDAVNRGEIYEGLAAVDLAGNPRLSGDKPDIGCYENDASAVSCDYTITPSSTFVGTLLACVPVVSGAEGKSLSYKWTFTNESSGTAYEFVGESPEVRINAPGTYTVRLEVFDDSTSAKLAEVSHAGAVKLAVRAVYVVPVNPNLRAPYDTWETAHTNIHEVMDALVGGCTVMLGEGEIIVTNQVEITKRLTFTGKGADKTTVKFVKSATGGNHRVFRINHANAVVEKMTITGGRNEYSVEYGGGVFIDIDGGTLQDCRVTGNAVGSNYGRGGGVGVNSEIGFVKRCVIDRNKSESGDLSFGGLAINGGHAENCLVYSNRSTSASGLWAGSEYKVTVSNCTFACNVATFDGAGGAFLVHRANNLDLVNCIFAGNRGVASTATDWGTPDVNELTVRWTSGSTDLPSCMAALTKQVKNSLFKFTDPALSFGTDCLNADPKFVDADVFNFHLLAKPRAERSPAIDAGLYDPRLLDETDLDGESRVKHVRRNGVGLVDLGCYESAYYPLGLIIKVY